MSLLTIVQRFCERTNLSVPTTVYGSTDNQVVQIKALLEEIGIDLNSRFSWNRTQFSITHTTLAAQDQGSMDTIAPGWGSLKNFTIWDRDRILPVLGPLTGIEWQALLAMFINGPYYQFRILNNRLLVNPTPPAGETWAFEYESKNWIVNGSTYKEYFTADDDEPVLPQSLLLMGLRAWWKKEKGLDYAEDMRMYEAMAKDESNKDGGKPVLKLDDSDSTWPRPGIWVSPGSWSV